VGSRFPAFSRHARAVGPSSSSMASTRHGTCSDGVVARGFSAVTNGGMAMAMAKGVDRTRWLAPIASSACGHTGRCIVGRAQRTVAVVYAICLVCGGFSTLLCPGMQLSRHDTHNCPSPPPRYDTTTRWASRAVVIRIRRLLESCLVARAGFPRETSPQRFHRPRKQSASMRTRSQAIG
jgi:hypothetical protein